MNIMSIEFTPVTLWVGIAIAVVLFFVIRAIVWRINIGIAFKKHKENLVAEIRKEYPNGLDSFSHMQITPFALEVYGVSSRYSASPQNRFGCALGITYYLQGENGYSSRRSSGSSRSRLKSVALHLIRELPLTDCTCFVRTEGDSYQREGHYDVRVSGDSHVSVQPSYVYRTASFAIICHKSDKRRLKREF